MTVAIIYCAIGLVIAGINVTITWKGTYDVVKESKISYPLTRMIVGTLINSLAITIIWPIVIGLWIYVRF